MVFTVLIGKWKVTAMKVNYDGFKIIEDTDREPEALYAMNDNIKLLYDQVRRLNVRLSKLAYETGSLDKAPYVFTCEDCRNCILDGTCRLRLELNEGEDAFDCNRFEDGYRW